MRHPREASTPEYSADLHKLARVNRGAREAMLIGHKPEAVLYYATQWPHGIGVGERSGR